MAPPEIRGRGRATSGLYLRQVVAGILTLTMFVMLGNMIKQEHFSPTEKTQIDKKLTDRAVEHVTVHEKIADPWQNNGEELKPCWENPSSDASVNDSKGFVSFSLTNGPEFHISQVVDAVMVARYLGATLLLPDILGTHFGEKWKFGEIYNDDKFIKSLNGVVKVQREQPLDMPNTIAVVKVPSRITKNSILENVKPIFNNNSNYIRLETYFPTIINMKNPNRTSKADSVACLAMFSTLELRSNIWETIELTVERLRTLNRESSGKFVAVDLRPEMVVSTNCRFNETCFGAKEVSEFLQKIGFGNDTTIYVTHSRRDSGLDELMEVFPKTYTKEDIIPEDKKEKFLAPQGTIFGMMLDYYICAQSDVFIPGISGLFYGNVAGTRIISGRTQILVPGNINGSSVEFVSSYVSAKNHLAYSCFC